MTLTGSGGGVCCDTGLAKIDGMATFFFINGALLDGIGALVSDWLCFGTKLPRIGASPTFVAELFGAWPKIDGIATFFFFGKVESASASLPLLSFMFVASVAASWRIMVFVSVSPVCEGLSNIDGMETFFFVGTTLACIKSSAPFSFDNKSVFGTSDVSASAVAVVGLLKIEGIATFFFSETLHSRMWVPSSSNTPWVPSRSNTP